MRKIFLILALVYSEELSDSLELNTSSWGGSFSLGLCTEKTFISTQEFSLIRYIDNQSEFYGTFSGFIIFTGNFGVGYKHYFNSRHKPSLFSSISLSAGFAGDPGGSGPATGSAINLSFGKSFKSSAFTNFLVQLLLFPYLGPVPISDKGNSFINLGLVLSYNNFFQSNHKLILLPIINLEIKSDW